MLVIIIIIFIIIIVIIISARCYANAHDNIPTGTPLTATSNAGGVGRNRDSEPISGLTACVNAAIG